MLLHRQCLTCRSAEAHIWMMQCSAASTAAAARSREQQRTTSPTRIALPPAKQTSLAIAMRLADVSTSEQLVCL
jgi:uncharacterized lipoprotein YbaY